MSLPWQEYKSGASAASGAVTRGFRVNPAKNHAYARIANRLIGIGPARVQRKRRGKLNPIKISVYGLRPTNSLLQLTALI